MATFSVTFSTDNAAFQDGYGGSEVARILTEVAVKAQQHGIESLSEVMRLRDYNGNRVGFAIWQEEDGEQP